ncbi:hypothetical protein F7Q99_00010 [Streptomyces kaniharaensis]|uniref:DUF4118 domain-containing protein n=1 Tax=Streptomyces kaniharaensis TaxID=212423 RepID=A0A6N7KH75_9ACTN|nr:hypothetical protein [Streptomyces kaniharaensis]MQS10706.1 hypothetical protein [Streptomyces kaniharaensis]
MYSARPGGRRYHPVLDRLPVAASGTVALVAGGALALGLGWLGELHAGCFPYVAYVGLAALAGAFSRPLAAPLVGLAAWLCCNAFVEHRHAELGWSGPGVEGGHFALFTVAALVISLPAALPRRAIRVERLPVGEDSGNRFG